MARLRAILIQFMEISKICTQLLCGHAPILFWPIFFLVWKHPLASQAPRLHPSSQLVCHKLAKGKKGHVSSKCTLNCIVLNVKHWWWISSHQWLLEQWTYLRELLVPSPPSLSPQPVSKWMSREGLSFFKHKLFSIILWPATQRTRCTMALWDSDSCWRNAVL